MEELWNIVLKERKTGYDHRKPKKRQKKSKKLTPNSLQKRDKNIKKLFENSPMNTKIDNQQIIINIPTAVSSEI